MKIHVGLLLGAIFAVAGAGFGIGYVVGDAGGGHEASTARATGTPTTMSRIDRVVCANADVLFHSMGAERELAGSSLRRIAAETTNVKLGDAAVEVAQSVDDWQAHGEAAATLAGECLRTGGLGLDLTTFSRSPHTK
jgi:hypothetical protein